MEATPSWWVSNPEPPALEATHYQLHYCAVIRSLIEYLLYFVYICSPPLEFHFQGTRVMLLLSWFPSVHRARALLSRWTEAQRTGGGALSAVCFKQSDQVRQINCLSSQVLFTPTSDVVSCKQNTLDTLISVTLIWAICIYIRSSKYVAIVQPHQHIC